MRVANRVRGPHATSPLGRAAGHGRLAGGRGEREVIDMARGGRSKVTSAKVARKASAALRDGRSSARTKSIAASALAQAKSK